MLIERSRGGHAARDHELERFDVRLTAEQAAARRELEKHDAERKEIAAPVDRLAARLLGRHVTELALELAGSRGFAHAADRLGDAEIHELHGAVRADEDVVRRDI